jgi:hypothetical protein
MDPILSLHRISTLHMSSTWMSTIPKQITHLTNLTDLDLSDHTSIAQIPPSIKKLTTLCKLNITYSFGITPSTKIKMDLLNWFENWQLASFTPTRRGGTVAFQVRWSPTSHHYFSSETRELLRMVFVASQIGKALQIQRLPRDVIFLIFSFYQMERNMEVVYK